MAERAGDDAAQARATPDPRLTPARADLAAKHLEGRVKAARFVEGVVREVVDAAAPVRRAPSFDAALDTEALKGERVTVYDEDVEGWSFVQLARDHYVGYVPTNALLAPGPEPTHRVAALRTFVFPGASIKVPPFEALPLGARVAITREQDSFAVTPSGFCIPRRHLALLATSEPDFVAVAERFLGTPYLWGGKTSLGIDCSGLVQVSLTAAGIPCPRDSDMQESFMSAGDGPRSPATPPMIANLSVGDSAATSSADIPSGLRRGDLIFWKGHVGIMRDADTLLHANAFHMAVATEPLAEAVARIAASGSAVTSVGRL